MNPGVICGKVLFLPRLKVRPRLDGLPKKLRHDAIVEVTFEVRFDRDQASVAEVIFGRLADAAEWHGFVQRRLPTADIPDALRRTDPNLRYQPAIELINPQGIKLVRIGPQVLGYTLRPPYPGWDKSFGAEVERVIDTLFKVVPKVSVTRLGLRYINAFRSDLHGITGIEKLNLRIIVDSVPLTEALNLNYTVPVSEDTNCVVRIATKDFAQGSIPENTTALADLDVFTKEPYKSEDIQQIKDWKEFAHIAEKRQFFRLLTDDTIRNLREE
jgi:uncharacterized protein (TIGR04255 family)